MAKPKLKAQTSEVATSNGVDTVAQENTGVQTAPAPEAKTLINLRDEFAQSPNMVLRKVNHVYAKKLLNNPNMTWHEFCDMKKEAFSEHWENKKTNPKANRVLRALSPKAIAKKQVAREKLAAKLAEFDAQLEKSGVKVQE